jgi:hypothetical protein
VPVAAITLMLGILIGLGVLFAWRHNQGRAEASGTRIVAVLPFENLGDSADAYFADGITDEVRGKLSQVPALAVIARASSNEYRHSTKSPTDCARLGAEKCLPPPCGGKDAGWPKSSQVIPNWFRSTRVRHRLRVAGDSTRRSPCVQVRPTSHQGGQRARRGSGRQRAARAGGQAHETSRRTMPISKVRPPHREWLWGPSGPAPGHSFYQQAVTLDSGFFWRGPSSPAPTRCCITTARRRPTWRRRPERRRTVRTPSGPTALKPAGPGRLLWQYPAGQRSVADGV